MLMEMTVKPCDAYFFAKASVCGNFSRQGPHQVAQKSTSTTFPFLGRDDLLVLFRRHGLKVSHCRR